MGRLVLEGGRARRRYSALDVLRIRLMRALTGPTSPGTRSRSFLQPVIAHGIVGMFLDECIVLDAFGRLKEPGPVAAQRYLVVWCAGDDDNLTSDILHGGEVMEALANVDNQLLVVPVTKLAHETLAKCCEVMTGPAAGSATGAEVSQ